MSGWTVSHSHPLIQHYEAPLLPAYSYVSAPNEVLLA